MLRTLAAVCAVSPQVGRLLAVRVDVKQQLGNDRIIQQGPGNVALSALVACLLQQLRDPEGMHVCLMVSFVSCIECSVWTLQEAALRNFTPLSEHAFKCVRLRFLVVPFFLNYEESGKLEGHCYHHQLRLRFHEYG